MFLRIDKMKKLLRKSYYLETYIEIGHPYNIFFIQSVIVYLKKKDI